MGMYFRKRMNMGPMRINLSRSGFGVSFGGKNLRVGVDAKGRSYSSGSIPGTGIGFRDYGKANSKEKIPEATRPVAEVPGKKQETIGFATLFLMGLFILVLISLFVKIMFMDMT